MLLELPVAAGMGAMGLAMAAPTLVRAVEVAHGAPRVPLPVAPCLLGLLLGLAAVYVFALVFADAGDSALGRWLYRLPVVLVSAVFMAIAASHTWLNGWSAAESLVVASSLAFPATLFSCWRPDA